MMTITIYNVAKRLFYIFVVLSSLFNVISIANATEMKEVFTDPKMCRIMEVGYGQMQNPLTFQGERWKSKFSNSSGCTVKVRKKDFESHASYCFLSSVDVERPGWCRFGLQSNGDYIFEFDGEKTVDCRFVCIKS